MMRNGLPKQGKVKGKGGGGCRLLFWNTMNRDQICDRFIELVPFELYPFQEEALLTWFEAEGGVLVSAPTGMGKTLIAEAAIFEALSTGTRLYYTTPLIALTDQKFREFQDRAEDWGFAREEIGLITGNRKVNPDAAVKVVVAEILLNHLLSDEVSFDDVGGVVMDEFHYFNDPERGVVWELSLILLPPRVRLMLLSATVGNAIEFLNWLREKHGRNMRLSTTTERLVPLEFHWVEDRLLTEQLKEMNKGEGDEVRAPALVFCFRRDECWEVAERIKGQPLIPKEQRPRIEEILERHDFSKGIGPKLKMMLIRGVGVHHAGVLPRYKEVVEQLFLEKLVPYVICTETLAAGINLPARSVVMSTLIKGKHGEKRLIPPSAAHQIFGRAGRPQFDTVGHVFALAHEDDVKIHKWKQKIEQFDPHSKDPGILKARKQLEKKKPSRRKTEQFWTEGQFGTLIKAGPANLYSRSMIPYRVLVYLLSRRPDLKQVRDFLTSRFNTEGRLQAFQDQLDHMLGNLQALGYLRLDQEADCVELDESVERLEAFRSLEPMYGCFLANELGPASFDEKLFALESVLSVPPQVVRAAGVPIWEAGPLQEHVLEPMMIAMGVKLAPPEPDPEEEREREFNPWKEEEERPPTFPEMLKLAFESKLLTPEDTYVQTKWLAGGIIDSQDDFNKFVASRSLQKNEGVIFRHLLRLVILSSEFEKLTEDPDYREIGERVTLACEQVDSSYTERFLAQEEAARAVERAR